MQSDHMGIGHSLAYASRSLSDTEKSLKRKLLRLLEYVANLLATSWGQSSPGRQTTGTLTL